MAEPSSMFMVQPSDEDAIARSAQRKAAFHLIPIIGVGYCLAYMDRINISFASLQMNRDLHFSSSIYGFGAGLFFIGYALCEVPSNLLLLHFGAKRWLARIMFTWGLLAALMMFVRTPLEFNVLRFLLGMAEAGFYPGIVYYLTLWFPANMRARAVSRFYIALPLSSVVMGALAGWLLGLNGKLGLAGWQWLFLVEGLPAVLFSFVILKMLPDGPAKAAWLTTEEKAWLATKLQADSQTAHLGHDAGILQALLSPKVWLIGAFFLCALTANYAYSFSAPAILQAATGWSVANVGYLIAGFGLLGALAMLLNSAHSDRTGERSLHCIVPCLIMAAGFLIAGLIDSGVDCGDCTGRDLSVVCGLAGAGKRRPDAVSCRTRRGRRPGCHEHHHHVQWLSRSLLDGPDERRDRHLPGRIARPGAAGAGRCGGDVCVDSQPAKARHFAPCGCD